MFEHVGSAFAGGGDLARRSDADLSAAQRDAGRAPDAERDNRDCGMPAGRDRGDARHDPAGAGGMNGVNPPSTDRNIPPRDVSQTCATCSYFPSGDCTNIDGRLQTTASTRACRLYFCIGDVERGAVSRAFRWDGSLHDRLWKVASVALIVLSRLPGCNDLACRIDVWRVEGRSQIKSQGIQ